MKSLWLKAGAAASTAVWSVAALAASSSTTISNSTTSAPSATTTADASVLNPTPKKLPLSVSSLHILYGPALSDPGRHQSADDAIGTVAPIYVRNQIGMGYALSDKVKITPTLDFDLQMNDTSNNPQNEGFHWRDCFIKIGHSDLFSADLGGNKISTWGDLRWFVPTSLGSKKNDLIGSLRLTISPAIQFGKSPWSISTINYVKYYFLENSTANSKDPVGMDALGNKQYAPLSRALFYTGPQLNYAFNDKVTAFVLYEAATYVSTYGMFDYKNYDKSNSDLEPGVSVQLHDRLTLIPGLNWYTNQPVSTTSATLTAILTLM